MKKAFLAVLTAYLADVTLREWYVARKARALADEMGRPMLNVGSGSGMSSITGPKLRGATSTATWRRRARLRVGLARCASRSLVNSETPPLNPVGPPGKKRRVI